MDSTRNSAAQSGAGNFSELRSRWSIVLACQIGICSGVVSLPFFTMGIFVIPLEEQYGWSRASIHGMYTVFVLAILLMAPLVGWLTDRFGVKPVILTSLFGTAIGFTCLGLLTQSISTYYLGGACLAILGAGTIPITWTTAINGWFNEQRGAALGLTLAATGIVGWLAPSYVNYLIDAFDWRTAYLGLAIIPIIVLPLVYLLLKEPPSSPTSLDTTSKTSSEDTPIIAGVGVAEATRDYRFWVIGIAFFFLSIAISGAIPNLVPLMIGGGMSASAAASSVGWLGFSVIAGSLAAGFLIDRLWAPGVAAFMLSIPAISAIALSQVSLNISLIPVSVILFGVAAGAEVHLIAYLTSRYFGLKHYAKIYSLLYLPFAAGTGLGPVLFGYFFDTQGNYQLIMQIAAGFFVFSGALLLVLGRYTYRS